MNIKITIDAPELAGAIESLAAALSSMNNPLPLAAPAPAKKEETKAADKPKQDKPKEEAPVKEDKKPEPAKEEKKPDPVKEEPKAEPEKEEPATDEKEEQLISLEVVRGKLAEFSAGSKDNQVAVMDALSRFGVKKLTDVEQSDYKELLELVGLSV